MPRRAAEGTPPSPESVSVEAYLKPREGPRKALENLGIRTVLDLLRHFPRAFEDRCRPRPVATLEEGQPAVVRGTVTGVRFRNLPGRVGRKWRRSVLQAVLTDDSGSVRLEIWNQPWAADRVEEGMVLWASGRASSNRGLRFVPVEWERAREEVGGEPPDEDYAWGRIVPFYPLARGLRQKEIRRFVGRSLKEWGDRVPDPLPPYLSADRGFPTAARAIRDIHRPPDGEARARAERRLRYEELLLLQLAVAGKRRALVREKRGFRYALGPRLDERIRARFPFRFTPAQDRVAGEILADLAGDHPMNRLLQGDVGSGKTAVALYAALAVVANRRQAAVLAPTEILAEQHHEGFRRALEGSRVRIELLAGSTRARRRREIVAATAAGEVDILVATHAVLERDVLFRDLGLAVVDEQHRFGVNQRKVFLEKGLHPDLLYMTATPIPRTLQMTRAGHLDVSVLDGKPPGRRPVTTLAFAIGDEGEAHDLVRREVAGGRQAFFICPLVEEEDEQAKARRRRRGDRELKAAVAEAERLRREVFPDLRVGLLHGRMKAEEKREVMEEFRAGRLHLLVSTVVVEVGVDIPNASVLAVLHAERYGLSQLHQLRGRIGRGSHRSYCLLLADRGSGEGWRRIRAMLETDDGFRIAEEDLRIRGPGEILGTRQAGVENEILLAGLLDHALHAAAKRDADALFARDPLLRDPAHRALKQVLDARYRDRSDRLRV